MMQQKRYTIEVRCDAEACRGDCHGRTGQAIFHGFTQLHAQKAAFAAGWNLAGPFRRGSDLCPACRAAADLAAQRVQSARKEWVDPSNGGPGRRRFSLDPR